MATPWPCPFPTYHDNTYPAISGKRIIIIGAGSGIGRETVFAFAAAGADHISILGRTERTLNETKDLAGEKFPKTSVSVYVCDVSKEEDVKRAGDAMGQWDVLVLNAGYVESPRRIEEVDVGDWWKTYEINVLGPLLLLKHLLPTRSPSSTTDTPAKIISTSAGIAHIPPTFCKTLSGYTSSKLAALRFFEVLAAEHAPEDLYVVSFQPGVVETTMLSKSGFAPPALDDEPFPYSIVKRFVPPRSRPPKSSYCKKPTPLSMPRTPFPSRDH
ncbi:MAG: hypothetical protein Q9160_004555 [Pyrenula sp. 1 TL-2023]